MANLTEASTFDAGVYQIETTDPVSGGSAGIANKPLINLANRTKYLKDHLDLIEAGTTNLPGYAKLASPTFTGSPAAPTPALGDDDTSLATTAFVQDTLGGVLSKSVAGGVNVTLTAVEAGNGILVFTGALTANISVIVPATPTRPWIVYNNTSGAFTLTVKTAAGTGQVVTQSKVALLFSDGTNVLDGMTDTAAMGLTGAITSILTSNLTASMAMVTDASGKVGNHASVTATELGYLDGVTSAIQTQLNGKAASGHTHAGYASLADPAFTGNPTAPTAAQFDNDTSLATTEFVQRALGSFSGKGVYTVSSTLTVSDVGRWTLVGLPSTGGTISLPSLANVPIGGVIAIFNYGPAVGVAAQTNQAINTGLGNPQTIVVQSGDTLILAKEADSLWNVVCGSAKMAFSPLFGASLYSNGFQKLPSGLLIQWGGVVSSASAAVQVVFPVAFSSFVSQTVIHDYDQNSTCAVQSRSLGSFYVNVWHANGTRLALNTTWIAIGR